MNNARQCNRLLAVMRGLYVLLVVFSIGIVVSAIINLFTRKP